MATITRTYRPHVTVRIPADVDASAATDCIREAERINSIMATRAVATAKDAISIAAMYIHGSRVSACLCPAARLDPAADGGHID